MNKCAVMRNIERSHHNGPHDQTPHHIKSLFERLGVDYLGSYYSRCLLRWAGHITRVPMGRMPRKLLTDWAEHARQVGCLQMSWGRTLN
jgi:hypothetical protein